MIVVLDVGSGARSSTSLWALFFFCGSAKAFSVNAWIMSSGNRYFFIMNPYKGGGIKSNDMYIFRSDYLIEVSNK